MNDRELEIALEHVGRHAEEAAKWKEAFMQMANYYCSLIEGSLLYVEDAYDLMEKHGIVDGEGFAL